MMTASKARQIAGLTERKIGAFSDAKSEIILLEVKIQLAAEKKESGVIICKSDDEEGYVKEYCETVKEILEAPPRNFRVSYRILKKEDNKYEGVISISW